jgi:chromosome segregation ATPase
MANRMIETDEELLARARRVHEERGRLTVRLLRAEGGTGDNSRLSAAVAHVNTEYEALERHRAEAVAAAGEDPGTPGAAFGMLPGTIREVILRGSDLIAASLAQTRSEATLDVQRLRDADRAAHAQMLAGLRAEQEELLDTHHQLRARAELLEQRLQGALGEIDELRAARTSQESHLATLIREHHEERTGLQAQLQAEREALDAARDRQHALDGEGNEIRAALGRAHERLDEALQRADLLQAEMTRSDTERDSALECLDEARGDLGGVRAELATAHAALAATVSERDSLRDHLNAARAEIERLTGQLAAGAAWTEQIRRFETLCTDVRGYVARTDSSAEEVTR